MDGLLGGIHVHKKLEPGGGEGGKVGKSPMGKLHFPKSADIFFGEFW